MLDDAIEIMFDPIAHRAFADERGGGDLMVVQTLGNQAHHLVFALGQLRKGSTTAPFGRARGSINVSYGTLGYRIRAMLRTTIRRHDTA